MELSRLLPKIPYWTIQNLINNMMFTHTKEELNLM